MVRVDANGGCVTVNIPAGEYEVRIFHDGQSDTVHPIFFRPENIDVEIAKKHGIADKLAGYFKEIINKFDF